jgi:hypothetical protein
MFNHDVNIFHQNVAFRMKELIGGEMKGASSKS